MEYGLTFVIDMYDFDEGRELHVLTMPGDYIRTMNWLAENPASLPETDTVSSLRRNYALAWHALKRRGKLAEMGMPEVLDDAAVMAMADRFSTFVNDVTEGDLPRHQERGR
jgi:hypothetical protein